MQASSVLSLFGIMRCLGAISGLISDRIGREVTITTGGTLATSATGVLILMMDGAQPWKFYYYALVQGYAMGLYTPTIAASVADIIRGPKVGWIIGLIWVSSAMGGDCGSLARRVALRNQRELPGRLPCGDRDERRGGHCNLDRRSPQIPQSAKCITPSVPYRRFK